MLADDVPSPWPACAYSSAVNTSSSHRLSMNTLHALLAQFCPAIGKGLSFRTSSVERKTGTNESEEGCVASGVRLARARGTECIQR